MENNTLLKKKYLCELCGNDMSFKLQAKDILYKQSNELFCIYECKKCKFSKILPELDYETVSMYYPKDYYSYNNASKKTLFLRAKEILIQEEIDKTKNKKNLFFYFAKFINIFLKIEDTISGIPRTKNISSYLDVGCGNGADLYILKKYGWKIDGFEIGEKSYVDNIYKDKSILDVDFENKKYKYIRIWGVLEHTPNPERIIKKLYNLLDDNGKLIILVPNTDSWWCKLFGQFWWCWDTPRHLCNFNASNLSMLVEKNNLKVSTIKHYGIMGFVASFQFFINEKTKMNLNLIDNIWIIGLFYPLEILSNIFKKGELIVLIANK